MDETQISITIRPIYIERFIYWIIILVLAVLLVLAYLKDDAQETKKVQDPTPVAQAQQPSQPEPEPVVAAEPEVSCTDATKNGNETDVDCGGTCTIKCASGSGCKANSDCVSNICLNSTCVNTMPVQLSGKLTLGLDDVQYVKSTANKVKVDGISYTLDNGLGQDIVGAQLKIFLMRPKSTSICLNQVDTSSCEKAFAVISLPTVKSGKKISEEHVFTTTERPASYVTENDFYRQGEQFDVVAYLYDANGEEIDGKSITARYQVTP
jgi:hypothetical protein